jgi:hypothetical protein
MNTVAIRLQISKTNLDYNLLLLGQYPLLRACLQTHSQPETHPMNAHMRHPGPFDLESNGTTLWA